MPIKPKKKAEVAPKDTYPKNEKANIHFESGTIQTIEKRGIKGSIESAQKVGSKWFITKREAINLEKVEYIEYLFEG